MTYCVKCGAAIAHGASACGSCGALVGSPSIPAPLPPPAPAVAAADPNAPSLGIAITGLVLNIIIWPGLGSLVAGDKVGWAQGFLFLLGVALFVSVIGLLLGIPLMIGMWVWGIVTGVRLIERANAKERAMRAAPPY